MTPFGFDEVGEAGEASANDIDGGGEISTDDFNDGEFECTCPRCGFKFNK